MNIDEACKIVAPLPEGFEGIRHTAPVASAADAKGVGAHTKGPWTLEDEPSQDHGQFVVAGPDGVEIAAVAAWIFPDRPEAEANARLIAAAPELLEALRPFADAFAVNSADGDCLTEADLRAMHNSVDVQDFRRACAAAAKATGAS